MRRRIVKPFGDERVSEAARELETKYDVGSVEATTEAKQVGINHLTERPSQ